MGFLWFVLGVIVGAAAIWFFLNRRCVEQLAERDREINELRSQLSAAEQPSKTDLLPSSSAPTDKRDSSSPSSGHADDLTRIKGIGSVLNGKLNRLGITTLRQIADFDDADIERINKELDFPGRIEREQWVEQAKALLGDD